MEVHSGNIFSILLRLLSLLHIRRKCKRSEIGAIRLFDRLWWVICIFVLLTGQVLHRCTHDRLGAVVDSGHGTIITGLSYALEQYHQCQSHPNVDVRRGKVASASTNVLLAIQFINLFFCWRAVCSCCYECIHAGKEWRTNRADGVHFHSTAQSQNISFHLDPTIIWPIFITINHLF